MQHMWCLPLCVVSRLQGCAGACGAARLMCLSACRLHLITVLFPPQSRLVMCARDGRDPHTYLVASVIVPASTHGFTTLGPPHKMHTRITRTPGAFVGCFETDIIIPGTPIY
ncbi:hypothetical protein NDU88_005646 [Pleurodeles waltl]|uniref:Secreted protein n=1 Tax=Pleurodeles waltl TaxID=8319 RepID=A0AAV7L4L8_PLEWA|nr:hypothetical protein NDU88_005646 [Pleurodeles waltl]